MSQTIDERIVEMRFDNKQFESGVKETLGTLDKLKSSLNLEGAAKSFEGLDKAAKNVDLQGIAAGIEALQNRFSTLGIVGMRVIENITDSLMNMASRAMGYVSDAIIGGGLRRAQNIENAHFQLQALLKDEEKVQAVMDNAMKSVDGTAYAYDEAAKAAAQFSASGMEAGEQMEKALIAITGVAAMTNSQYEDISRIFTTVAGNGRLMGDQLLQLSSRGLNAAATLADYFKEVRGQSNMTESTIRQMVSAGKISFQDFAEAMNWAFGESAFRANETFTGALSNMKSALARIGAEFFSPLIEQNSDLILLINTLRERINDVKKAVTFDEQASAISGMSKEVKLMNETVSQFVKDGTMEFSKFTDAIFGTTKSEKELTDINEKLSESYAKVKENGAASVDTLIEFNENGINATQSIREYINGVLDGTIKASDVVQKSIWDISKGTKLVAGDVLELAKDGKISYDIFTDAIVNSSGVIQNEATMASDAITQLMSKVKEQGSVTMDTLIEFNQNGINAATALREYMNGVTDGTIRASYSTKQAIEAITDGTKIASGDIARYMEEGKISYDIFQSAMENAYGDQKALSKQFTDFILDSAKAVSAWLKALDLSKPMSLLYYGAESVKNILTGLLSVLKPLGNAFSDVFLTDTAADGVIILASKIEELTSKMKLSEKSSKNLQDAFKGIFSVVKLVVDVFAGLFGITLSVGKPIGSLTDLVLALVGAFGRGLTTITGWIRKSPALGKAYTFIASGVSKAMSALSGFLSNLDEFADYIYNLPIVQKTINEVVAAFNRLYNKGNEYLPILVNKLKEFRDWMLAMIPDKAQELFDIFVEKLKEIKNALSDMDLNKARDMFKKFTDKLKDLVDVLRGNEGLDTFIKNMKVYFDELTDVFNFDTLLSNIDKFKNGVSGFVQWFRETIGPIFDDFSFGGLAATAGGFSIIYAVIKSVEAFDKIGKSLEALPNTLGAIKSTLLAYQKDLKADAMLKVAKAIAVLAGALTILSFADTERLYKNGVILVAAGGLLVLAMKQLSSGIASAKGLTATVNTVANTLAKSLNNLAKAVKWKAIGSAIKDMAIAIGIIVASIVVLAVSYSKDAENMNKAVVLIGEIAAVMVGLIVVMSALGNKLDAGMKAFAKAGAAILALSVSLIVVINALKMLFKLEIPDDLQDRLLLLASVFAGLGMLAVAVGVASRIGGKNSIKSGPILALTAALYVSVLAMKQLFALDLPDDYQTKFGILAGIFGGFVVAVMAIGVASRVSKDGLKGAGTILAMCAFVITAVAALAVLSIFPAEKLLTGAIALGTTLIALGLSMAGTAKIAGKDTWKTVAAMALQVGVITAALGILSMVPADKLLVSANALGAVLLALATDFLAVSKISDDLAFTSILSMTANVAVVAYSLYVLSEQSWASLLSAAVSMSAVLLAVAAAFKIIGNTKVDPLSITAFIGGIIGVLMTAVSLSILASQPWEGILAGATAISAVLLSIAGCFAIMSSVTPNLGTLVGFISGIVGIGVIAFILSQIASQPWEGLLAAASSISMLLLSMSAAMVICTAAGAAAGPALIGMGLLDLFIANLALILYALGNLSEKAESFLDRGGEILTKLGTYLGEFVGNIIGGVLTGITGSLPQVGQDLSDFATNAGTFFDIVNGLDGSVLTGAKNLAETILILTAAEILNGIGSLLTGKTNFAEFGTELKEFGIAISEFSAEVTGINGSDVETAANCAKVLAEFASNLPREGGWMQKILGESKSLGEFAEELIPFGTALVTYSDTVAGRIDQTAVEASIKAAEVLAAFADKLPDMGGLAGMIFGDQKTLAEFAEELIPFGYALVEYSDAVAGKIDQTAVEASIKAAEVLLAFADNLPDMGGLAGIIFGNQKTLAEFAEEIIPFGAAMVEYSDIVAGNIDQSAVEASANAAKALAELQNGLGNSGGIVSWFTGDNDLDDFGKQLKKFGQGLADYSDSVSGIDTNQLSLVIAEVQKLVDLANATSELDTSGMTGFSEALSAMATTGIDEFVTTFSESTEQVSTAIQTFVTNVNTELTNSSTGLADYAKTVGVNIPDGIKSGIEQNQPSLIATITALAVVITSTMRSQLTVGAFSIIGQTAIQNLIDGINTKKPLAIATSKNLCDAIISTYKVSLPNTIFNSLGQNIVQGLAAGMISRKGTAEQAAKDVANVIIQAFKNNLSRSEFESIGRYAAEGLADGIKSKINQIAQAATEAAKQAINSAKSELQVRSPSRVFYGIGEYVSMGLANGIVGALSLIGKASEKAANKSVDTMNSIIQNIGSMLEDNEDFQPTIRPVLDLSQIEGESDRIAEMFNRRIGTLYANVAKVSSGFEANRNGGANSGKLDKGSSKQESTYILNQYNTSPKALSRIEIYRDTKNLFSTLKGVVEKQ